ncbi:MAG: hypothetical protein JOZ69_24525, partial [Myxococcales bacterium]|nr:hypothetical protein [Myxococcales bacterium]
MRLLPWMASASFLFGLASCQRVQGPDGAGPSTAGSPGVAALAAQGPAAAGAGADAKDGGSGEVIETIYDGGLKNWADWGWAKREVTGPGPAKIDFSNWGGWIIANPGNTQKDFGSLVFRVKASDGNPDFIEVHLVGPGGELPTVHVESQNRSRLGGALAGWEQIELPFADLDPDGAPFDRVVLHAGKSVGSGWTLIDHVALTKSGSGAPRPPPAAAYANAPHKSVALSVACGAAATKISPYIYGIAYSHIDDAQQQQWKMGATIRRWGGNNMSRYNWQLHAFNLDSDWFWENAATQPYTKFLADSAEHGMESALVVPMIGWVAKDTTSVSFPVSVYGPQDKTDPSKPEAGDGTKGGK